MVHPPKWYALKILEIVNFNSVYEHNQGEKNPSQAMISNANGFHYFKKFAKANDLPLIFQTCNTALL